MAEKIIMPQAGVTMEEGTIVKWLKGVGEYVKKDEPIVEVETDKVQMEIESTASGTLLKILVEEGETVPVTTPIAFVGEKGEVLGYDR